jgi:hypothetical protein
MTGVTREKNSNFPADSPVGLLGNTAGLRTT